MKKRNIIHSNHMRHRRSKLRMIAVTAIAAAVTVALSVTAAYSYAAYKADLKENDYYTEMASVQSINGNEIIFVTSDGNMWLYIDDSGDINLDSEYRLMFNGNHTLHKADDEIVTFWEVNVPF